MWTKQIMSVDFYHIVQWFLVYSFLGWVLESIYMSFCNRKLTNRGFMKGPMCPIYGVGALLAFFTLRRFVEYPVILFFAGSILATTWEYVTAHIMIWCFGEFWWDYKDKPFNYKGMLCLESSIGWGVYTLAFFYIIHGPIMQVASSYSFETGIYFAKAILALCFMDFACTFYEVKKDSLTKKVTKVRQSIRFRIAR